MNQQKRIIRQLLSSFADYEPEGCYFFSFFFASSPENLSPGRRCSGFYGARWEELQLAQTWKRDAPSCRSSVRSHLLTDHMKTEAVIPLSQNIEMYNAEQIFWEMRLRWATVALCICTRLLPWSPPEWECELIRGSVEDGPWPLALDSWPEEVQSASLDCGRPDGNTVEKRREAQRNDKHLLKNWKSTMKYLKNHHFDLLHIRQDGCKPPQEVQCSWENYNIQVGLCN